MTKNNRKRISLLMIITMILAFITPYQEAYANTMNEEFIVTPGVIYKDNRFTQNSTTQASRILDINLNQQDVGIELGIPKPVNTLGTLSSRTKKDTYEGHRVIGGINASFFHTDTKLPAYLLAWKEDVGTLGVISTGFDEYMSVPTAFGITANGTAQIERFSYDSFFEVEGQRFNIHSINKERGISEVIAYTPTYRTDSTRSNSYGMEIVVANTSVGLDAGVQFGKVITGTVQEVTPYGKGDSVIPRNGYVISIQGGDEALKYAHIKPGQEIKLTINVDNKWKNAQFMLGSGPMLVQNGMVDMTIDENSSRAKTRAPRTAVAIDKTGKRVFFVTVDGRQSGYSSGMNLKEFAQYLVSIGAERAINLDGGGSTTMVARRHGNLYPTVVNRPSDGRERAVSAILQVVSTAPNGTAITFDFKKKQEGPIMKGSSVELEPITAMDSNYHVIPMDRNKITYSVEGNIGRIEGNTFIATNEGTGNIVGQYGQAVKKIPVTVTKALENEALLLNTFDQLSAWKSESAKSTTKLTLSTSPGPTYHGSSALKMEYDFTGGDSGIKASYAASVNPIRINGSPSAIGMWVYGDGNKHWLRGKLMDGAGKEHTINFTEEGKLDWNGWRYVKAILPSSVVAPIAFTKLYVAEAYPERQGKGILYFDKLQAEYGTGYIEPIFNDVPNNHIFKKEISYLNDREIITGYSNGYFKPNQTLSRVHAAVLLVRALNIQVSNERVNYKDLPVTHQYYKEIVAVTKAGLMTGKNNNTIFDANGTLSRSQMAAILVRAYGLSGTIAPTFKDVPTSHWAHKEIHALAANKITTGYEEDHTFRPENNVTRGQFSAFIYRAMTR